MVRFKNLVRDILKLASTLSKKNELIFYPFVKRVKNGKIFVIFEMVKSLNEISEPFYNVEYKIK